MDIVYEDGIARIKHRKNSDEIVRIVHEHLGRACVARVSTKIVDIPLQNVFEITTMDGSIVVNEDLTRVFREYHLCVEARATN